MADKAPRKGTTPVPVDVAFNRDTLYRTAEHGDK